MVKNLIEALSSASEPTVWIVGFIVVVLGVVVLSTVGVALFHPDGRRRQDAVRVLRVLLNARFRHGAGR